MRLQRALLFMSALFLVSAGLTFAEGSAEKGTVGEVERIPVEIAAYPGGNAPVDEDCWTEVELERRFPDLDFKLFVMERATWVDQLNTRIAGGDIPDILPVGNPVMLIEYIQQGVLAELPFDFLKQHAPIRYNSIIDHGPIQFIASRYENKNWGIPHERVDKSYPVMSLIRVDWLQNVGIEKKPETMAELEEAFKRFTYNDPDQNGKNDTYGLTERYAQGPRFSFEPFFRAYGSGMNAYYIVDGKVRYSLTLDETKQALETLNRWYELGYLDPEFVVNKDAVQTQKWANGVVGFVQRSTWGRALPGGQHYDAVKAIHPEAIVEPIYAPKGPDGYHAYPNWGVYSSGPNPWGSVVFGSHLEGDAKLAKVVHFVDQVTGVPELFELMRYGEEGTHWQRDENDRPEFIQPYDTPQRRGPIGNDFWGNLGGSFDILSRNLGKQYEELTQYGKAAKIKYDGLGYATFFVPDEFAKEFGTIRSEIWEVGARWVANFIMGDKDIEDDWDDFLKEMKDAGVDRHCEIYQMALDNSNTEVESLLSDLGL